MIVSDDNPHFFWPRDSRSGSSQWLLPEVCLVDSCSRVVTLKVKSVAATGFEPDSLWHASDCLVDCEEAAYETTDHYLPVESDLPALSLHVQLFNQYRLVNGLELLEFPLQRDAVAMIRRFLFGVVCDEYYRWRLATLMEVGSVMGWDDLNAQEMLAEARAELEVYLQCMPRAPVLTMFRKE